MTISRDDLSSEGNTTRRLFWEKCASRQPITDSEGKYGEDASDVASWADFMLVEWDKRWIADEKEKDKLIVLNCSIDDLLDKMEEASAGGSLQSPWTRDKIADVIKKEVSNV